VTSDDAGEVALVNHATRTRDRHASANLKVNFRLNVANVLEAAVTERGSTWLLTTVHI